MANVAVIGLGAMGAPMARRLLRAGHRVAVFARRPEAMAPLVADGAAGTRSPGEAATGADVTITMVTDTAAVEAVTLGPEGVIAGAAAGSVVVDHSTIHYDRARRIALTLRERGIDAVDAPVSGGAAAAESGELAIMAGGSEAVVERLRPVFSCYGRTIAYIGPSGAGQIAKACNQICTIVNILGAAEAMVLAERAGVDPSRVKDVMMAGFAASRMLDLQAPKMIDRAFTGRVESRLHDKDIRIVLDMAHELGLDLPGSEAAAAVFGRLQARGGGRLDSAAIFTILAGEE